MAQGLVISQNPVKGAKIKEGKTVKITVSLGAKMVAVPQIIGRTENDGLKALESVGLTADILREYNNNYETGVIFNVLPAPGAQTAGDSKVTIYVSKGAEKIKAPGIVGLSANDANARIQANDLTIGTVTEDYSSTYPAGAVMSQSPEEGTEVEAKTAVDYVISKGINPHPDPEQN